MSETENTWGPMAGTTNEFRNQRVSMLLAISHHFDTPEGEELIKKMEKVLQSIGDRNTQLLHYITLLALHKLAKRAGTTDGYWAAWMKDVIPLIVHQNNTIEAADEQAAPT